MNLNSIRKLHFCVCVCVPWLSRATDSAWRLLRRRECEPCRQRTLWWTRSSPAPQNVHKAKRLSIRLRALNFTPRCLCKQQQQTNVLSYISSKTLWDVKSCSPSSVCLEQTGRNPGRLCGPESVWSLVLWKHNNNKGSTLPTNKPAIKV